MFFIYIIGLPLNSTGGNTFFDDTNLDCVDVDCQEAKMGNHYRLFAANELDLNVESLFYWTLNKAQEMYSLFKLVNGLFKWRVIPQNIIGGDNSKTSAFHRKIKEVFLVSYDDIIKKVFE